MKLSTSSSMELRPSGLFAQFSVIDFIMNDLYSDNPFLSYIIKPLLYEMNDVSKINNSNSIAPPKPPKSVNTTPIFFMRFETKLDLPPTITLQSRQVFNYIYILIS
jgi:hypothetical protein